MDNKKKEQLNITYTNGDRYEGDFETGVGRIGYGIYYFANGRKYEGHWIKNQMNQVGVFSWPNGDRAEGIFKDGFMHGNGVFYYADGRKYVGNWINGKDDGSGILTWPNETTRKNSLKDSR
jgi:hypothetical protein